MKKILSTLYLTLISMISFAQVKADTSGHLTFKGIAIDGTLDEYVSKMKRIGFRHLSTNDGNAMLEGDFASYKNCIISVSTLKQKDLVHKIDVMFPDKDKWSTLSGNYFDLKQLLTEKYGIPSNIVEEFDTRIEPRDDQSKMYEVQFDHCKYYSNWTVDKGEIQLSIEHIGMRRCFIKLTYFDKSNSATIKKQALEDL